MPCACIDIGSNTTRLLVAEGRKGGLAEVLQQRAFTRLGRATGRDGRIDARKIAEVAEVVATQRRVAEELGADPIRAVGTAALREAVNRGELLAAVRAESALDVEILTGEEEARLAFVGATRTLADAPGCPIAVIDVGGGSSELVVGTTAAGVSWSASFRIGSGFLADAYLHSDPPAAAELHAVREHVGGALEGLSVPPCGHAVAVGGSATSLRRLVGAVLDPDTLDRGLRVLSGAPSGEVARRFAIDAERVRLLPAGMLILQAAAERLGRPLHIGRGGLREGVVLELLGDRAHPPAEAA